MLNFEDKDIEGFCKVAVMNYKDEINIILRHEVLEAADFKYGILTDHFFNKKGTLTVRMRLLKTSTIRLFVMLDSVIDVVNRDLCLEYLDN